MDSASPCPACLHGTLHRVSHDKDDLVRGVPVHVTKILCVCGSCGAEFENTLDPDWRLDAYAQYRAATGMVSPEVFASWRRRQGLSTAEVADLLAWNEVTVRRYESGSLATPEHNGQMVSLMLRYSSPIEETVTDVDVTLTVDGETRRVALSTLDAITDEELAEQSPVTGAIARALVQSDPGWQRSATHSLWIHTERP